MKNIMRGTTTIRRKVLIMFSFFILDRKSCPEEKYQKQKDLTVGKKAQEARKKKPLKSYFGAVVLQPIF